MTEPREAKARAQLDRLRVLVEAGISPLLRAFARRAPSATRRDGGRADGRSLCRTRGDRWCRPGPRAVLHERNRPRDLRRDRGASARPRHSRRPDPRRETPPASRDRGRCALGRVSAQPSADADVPRRPNRVARRRVRNLYLTEKAGSAEFTPADEELTQLLAAQAAVAIENARLYESSTRWLRQLETLNEIGSALASEVELEPLLDLVARRMQELVGARIVLIALPDARDILRVVAAAGRDLVGLELRPSALDDFGLVPAVERLASTVSERSGQVVDVKAQLGEERLPPDVETALYRIVQEALTNVVKHASAARVSITLVRKGRAALVVVEDDGRGFDVEATRPRALGFVGMRERVALVGGRLMVESTPGAGTTLVAELPTEDDEDRS